MSPQCAALAIAGNRGRVRPFEREPELQPPMRRHRTARGLFLAVTAAAFLAGAAAAWAVEVPPPPGGKPPPPKSPPKAPPSPPTRNGVPQLIFPVVGPATYTNDFGDARGRGSHEGNDIMAPKRAIAVAAEAGTVKFHVSSWNAGCMLYLYGKSGTTYLYIHLNNDLTLKNDNRGKCVTGVAFAKGLKSGARVAAGEPVGYVGDSGDANGIASHLHFEVHPRGNGPTNPYTHLRNAKKLLFSARAGTTVDVTLTGSLVTAAVDAVTVKVDRLRASTGLRVPEVKRNVEVALPPSVQLESAAGQVLTRLVRVRTGQPLEVKTAPARTTLAAQLGLPGALEAERVVVLR